MKSKISKILGVALSISIIASLMVTAAIPVGAAAGTNGYGVIDTPSKVGSVLAPGVNIDFMVASADGMVVFAYDATAHMMYKSTNGGETYDAGKSVGTGTAVGLVISPNFSIDSTVVLAETAAVYWTTSAGSSWINVAPEALGLKLAATGTVTSVAVGNYFQDNLLSILVGVTGTPGGGVGERVVNVLKFKTGGFSWEDVGTTLTANVIGVAFSSNHLSDAEIIAVTDAGVVTSKFGTLAWNNAAYPDLTIAAAAGATRAVIGLPSNYVGNNGASFLVGFQGTTDARVDLYLVKGRASSAGTASIVKDNAVATSGGIKSLSVTDSLATVFVGEVGGTVVAKSTTVTGSSVSWSTATVLGASPNVIAIDSLVLAGTSGTTSAFQASHNGGGKFMINSLISVSAFANVSLYDIKAVDNNTMFLLLLDANGNNDFYLFKTGDGGASWYGLALITPATSVILEVKGDNVAYITNGSSVVQKSADGGFSFTGVGVPTGTVTALGIFGDNIYVGGAAAFYKAGRWTPASGLAGNIFSIAFNADGSKIAVGNDAGQVFESTNDGVSFTELKTAPPTSTKPGTGNMYVAYAPDGTLYTADSAGTGIKYYDGTTWKTSYAGVAAGGLAITGGGVLYATDMTAHNGFARSLTPAASAPEYEVLNDTNFASMNGVLGNEAPNAALNKLQVVSADSTNTLYALETTYTPTTNTFGYVGRLYGFMDAFLTAPTQSAPSGNVTGTTSTPISWEAFPGAKSYQVQVSTDSSFASGTNYYVVNATSFTATGLSAGSTNYWRVRAIGTGTGAGTTDSNLNTPWSGSKSFITALNPINITVVQYPANGSTSIPVDATFTWTIPTNNPGSTTYVFQIAEEIGQTDKFAIPDFAANTDVPAYKLETMLKYNTQYWWRVKSVTGDSESAWTTAFFTTEKEPVTTTPVTPTITTSTIIVEVPTTEPVTPTLTVTYEPQPDPTPIIPTYLLWIIVAVGAVLFIAVIVLIVRTRRIS